MAVRSQNSNVSVTVCCSNCLRADRKGKKPHALEQTLPRIKFLCAKLDSVVTAGAGAVTRTNANQLLADRNLTLIIEELAQKIRESLNRNCSIA